MKKFTIHCEQMGCRYTIRQGHGRSTYHDALKDLSFTMTAGERLGLVGVNGAGKSSLLRVMAGVLYPTSGQIIREGSPKCSLLSLVAGWYPDLSGRENAILACLMGGLRKREAEQRLETIIEFSELGEWLDRPVRTYSTGMSSRLALAAALQIRPDVLLLDETLSVGDATFQKKARSAIMDMMKGAQSVVLVSHDASSIKTICDRVLWLEKGCLKMDGSTNEVLAAYQAWTATVNRANPAKA